LFTRRFLLLLFVAVAPVLTPAAEAPTRKAIDAAMADLAEVTGFQIKAPLEFQLITRDQVKTFLSDKMKAGVKPEEIRAEELTLKMFGFVPQDFDLKKSTLDLLTEQTAAFYDFHEKKLFITDWAATKMEDEALIHELAHALADQNFHLEKYTRKVEDDSEKSLARQAVVEGQAQWLTRAVLLKRGMTPTTDESAKPQEKDDDSPVFDKAPLYFQVTLMFPYDAGEAFSQSVFEKFGKEGFTRVFQHPPVSAQQILHPEKYFAGVTPLDVDLPPMKGMKRLVEGPVGELDHAILLQQYIGKQVARDLSAHWRGGNFRIYENKKKKLDVLVYRSVWTDDASAQWFFGSYEKILKAKWKNTNIASRTDKRIDGKGDDGYFCVDLSATVVTSREGLSAPCEPEPAK
jgi:hypothetical protein